MKRLGIGALLVAVALCAAGGLSPSASAQQYPPATPTEPPPTDPPTPTPDEGGADIKCDLASCLRMSGEVGDSFRANEVEQGGDIRVVAVEGCCEANARVDVYIESVRTYLGTVTALEDGSYRADLKLPASIGPGRHTLIADIEGCGELRRTIQVLSTSSGRSGTAVGGVSETNDGSENDRGGVLPRTGGGIALLVLWALVLVGLGTLLVKATRRRFAGAAPGRAATLALPAPDVPFVDTSRFVPYRSRTASFTVEDDAPDRSNGEILPTWDAPGSERHTTS